MAWREKRNAFDDEIRKYLLFDVVSNPKSVASVCKNLCKNEPVFARPLMRSRNLRISRFTQVNSVRFDRFEKQKNR